MKNLSMDPEPLLTAVEVSQWLRLHVNAVKRIRPADLPFFRVSDRGDRRYRESDVIAYIERRTER